MSTPAHHDPAECFVCQRRATGLGVGNDRDPKWLCVECSLIASQIRATKRLDVFEVNALEGGLEAVGEYLGEINKTDLADFTDIEARMLVKRAWLAVGNRIRKQIREKLAPF